MTKLPIYLDVAQLKQELSQFSEPDWVSHSPEGQASLILVSVGGTLNHDFAISGPLAPTPFLERCPYLKQFLANLAIPLSRCRLIKLPPLTETKWKFNYHWFRRVPIYAPVLTHPEVKCCSPNQNIHLPSGEVWLWENSQRHRLVNKATQDCIHLVVETKTTLVETLKQLPKSREISPQLLLEPYSFEVLTPPEISHLTEPIHASLPTLELVNYLKEFKHRWEHTFTRFGHSSKGELAYQELICYFNKKIASKAKPWLSEEARNAIEVISSMLATSHYPPPRPFKFPIKRKRHPDLHYQMVTQAEPCHHLSTNDCQILNSFHSPATPAEAWCHLPSELGLTKSEFTKTLHKLIKLELLKANFLCPTFERPIFIVSAPRAGSTLLFEILAQFPEVWTIGGESHEIIESIPELHPAARNYSSNRLTELEALPHLASLLRERFTQPLHNRQPVNYLTLPMAQRPTHIRFLEKTPRNAFRIPFLRKLFPEALFIYLYRNPQENISSLLEGWRARRVVAYRQLPNWPYRDWFFVLPPGWSTLQNSSLVEIAAYQWKSANFYIWQDLQTLPKSAWCLVRYADLIRKPREVITQLSQFAGLTWDSQVEQIMSQPLPLSKTTLSVPAPDKWRKHEQEITQILPSLEPVTRELGF